MSDNTSQRSPADYILYTCYPGRQSNITASEHSYELSEGQY
jgi:hypothetical protein